MVIADCGFLRAVVYHLIRQLQRARGKLGAGAYTLPAKKIETGGSTYQLTMAALGLNTAAHACGSFGCLAAIDSHNHTRASFSYDELSRFLFQSIGIVIGQQSTVQ